MTPALEKYIRNCINISDTDLEKIDSLFEKKNYPKKTILLRDGEICKEESFIIKGCIKTYFIDKEGQEVILTFSTENWWVSDIYSFQEQTPSKMFIETIEDTELLLLTPSNKEKLLQTFPALEKMFRLMVQRHLHSYQERLFGNIALSAEERYEQFLQKYPALPQRISQHLIASYLGISAEFLSRLRTRKAKK
ncbi:MAG: Crp/Fnr family transcriptional regulator [Bacteroidota bacterium]